jgi:putative modified peptide
MPFKPSEKIVDALLDKLSSDDAFRSQFQADPRAALASLGHEDAAKAGPDDKGIWACCRVKELASKEAIRSARAALREQLLSDQATFNPISLSA